MNRIKSGLLGFAAGLLNGLFGAGGGMAAVLPELLSGLALCCIGGMGLACIGQGKAGNN